MIGKKLDHIALAVQKAEKVQKVFEEAFGWSAVHEEEVPSEGVRVVMLEAPSARIELLEPLRENTPVGKFLQKRGEGLHHLCYEVENIEETLEKLREKGVEILEPAPRKGAKGAKIAFLHPKSTGGVLIELKEVPKS